MESAQDASEGVLPSGRVEGQKLWRKHKAGRTSKPSLRWKGCATSEQHLPPPPAGSRRDPPRSEGQHKIQEDRNYPEIRRCRRTTASSHENPLKRVRSTTSFNRFSRTVTGDLNPRRTCEKNGVTPRPAFRELPQNCNELGNDRPGMNSWAWGLDIFGTVF